MNALESLIRAQSRFIMLLRSRVIRNQTPIANAKKNPPHSRLCDTSSPCISKQCTCICLCTSDWTRARANLESVQQDGLQVLTGPIYVKPSSSATSRAFRSPPWISAAHWFKCTGVSPSLSSQLAASVARAKADKSASSPACFMLSHGRYSSETATAGDP